MHLLVSFIQEWRAKIHFDPGSRVYEPANREPRSQFVELPQNRLPVVPANSKLSSHEMPAIKLRLFESALRDQDPVAKFPDSASNCIVAR